MNAAPLLVTTLLAGLLAAGCSAPSPMATEQLSEATEAETAPQENPDSLTKTQSEAQLFLIQAPDMVPEHPGLAEPAATPFSTSSDSEEILYNRWSSTVAGNGTVENVELHVFVSYPNLVFGLGSAQVFACDWLFELSLSSANETWRGDACSTFGAPMHSSGSEELVFSFTDVNLTFQESLEVEIGASAFFTAPGLGPVAYVLGGTTDTASVIRLSLV